MKTFDYVLIAVVISGAVLGFADHEIAATIIGVPAIVLASYRFYDSSQLFGRNKKLDRCDWHACSDEGHDINKNQRPLTDETNTTD